MKIASIWYRSNVHNSIVVVQFEHCASTKKVEFIYEEKIFVDEWNGNESSEERCINEN